MAKVTKNPEQPVRNPSLDRAQPVAPREVPARGRASTPAAPGSSFTSNPGGLSNLTGPNRGAPRGVFSPGAGGDTLDLGFMKVGLTGALERVQENDLSRDQLQTAFDARLG